MTNRGFYSVVEKEWDRKAGTLTVRARRRKDIERFMELVDDDDLDKLPAARQKHAATDSDFIEFDDLADYAWRIRAPRGTVAIVHARMLSLIDYDNFKSSVSRAGLHDHASCYSSVWSAMMRLQEKGRYALTKISGGGGGKQGNFPFWRGGGDTKKGVRVADELGYPGPQATFDVDELESATCPFCAEPIGATEYEAEACSSCENQLECCENCGELMGYDHDCPYVESDLPPYDPDVPDFP